MERIGIETLVEEHNNIIAFIELVEKSSIEIMNGGPVDTGKFKNFIDFARNYADKHHHGKEELILFRLMEEKLGEMGKNLIRHGMLVEHDLGRLFILTLEEAIAEYEKTGSDLSKIQIISNAIGYGNHLRRHIEKENNAVYTFAEKNLSDLDLDIVDEETKKFEKDNQIQKDKYLLMLKKLTDEN